MTKLVKNLIIGGTGTTVIAGAGAGVGVSLSQKKAANRNEQPVVAKAAQPTVTVEGTFALPSFSGIREVAPVKIENKEVFSGTAYAVPTMEAPAIHVPTPTPSQVPNMVPNIAPQAVPQMVPNAIPSLVPEQVGKIPHLVFKPVLPAGGFVFGGRTQVVTPPLKGIYQTHEGINHAEAIDGYLQTTPQAVPNAVPYQVPQTVEPTFPAKALVFGAHAQEVTPPLKGTIQTHEGIHHLALDSDMQLIPETPAHPTLPQAVPYVVPAMQQEVYKNTLGDPYIQNEWVEFNGAAVVWTIDDHQVPFLYKAPVAPTAIPSMVPGQVPTATPTQVLPEQKVPMMINNYGQPAASDWYATAKDHDHYAVPRIAPSLKDEVKPVAQPYAVPAARNVEVMSQVVLKDGMMTAPILVPTIGSTPYITPSLKTTLVPYEVPSLKSSSEEVVSSDVDSISIDPASKLAAAYIVGAVRQPIFETFVATPVVSSSVDLATESSFGATYHVIEGINHASYFNGILQQTPSLAPSATPNLAPSAVPYLVPKLGPVIAPVLAPQEAHVHSVYAEHDQMLNVNHVHSFSAPHDVTTDVDYAQSIYAVDGITITEQLEKPATDVEFTVQQQKSLFDIITEMYNLAADGNQLSHEHIRSCLSGFNHQEIKNAANNIFGSLRTRGERDDRMFGLHDRFLHIYA